MAGPTLKINNTKTTDHEFDISVQGLDATSEIDVRFVVESVDGFDASIRCTKTSGQRWAVSIPPMPVCESKSFKVEVIVDGYYFVPASGALQVISPPRVEMSEAMTPMIEKPSVIANFGMTSSTVSAPEPKNLVEYSDLGSRQRTDLEKNLRGLSSVMNKASTILDQYLQEGSVDTVSISKVIGLVRQAVTSVEVRIYL